MPRFAFVSISVRLRGAYRCLSPWKRWCGVGMGGELILEGSRLYCRTKSTTVLGWKFEWFSSLWFREAAHRPAPLRTNNTVAVPFYASPELAALSRGNRLRAVARVSPFKKLLRGTNVRIALAPLLGLWLAARGARGRADGPGTVGGLSRLAV